MMMEIHVTHHEVFLNYELMHVLIEFMIFKGDYSVIYSIIDYILIIIYTSYSASGH